jgi:hypothetical protein
VSTITAILEPSADGTLHLPVPWTRGRFRVQAQVEILDSPVLAEHSIVCLSRDLGEGLKAGEIGTIVHVYDGGAGYEVEFLRGRERPLLMTVEPEDIELSEAE